MQGLTSTLCCICTKGCAELPCCSGSGSFLKAQETRDTLRYHSMLHRRQADGAALALQQTLQTLTPGPLSAGIILKLSYHLSRLMHLCAIHH